MKPHIAKWTVTFKVFRWEGDRDPTTHSEAYDSEKSARDHARFVYRAVANSPADRPYIYEAHIVPPRGTGKPYRYMRKVNNKWKTKPEK